MRCGRCGALVDPSGVFPGGKVMCGCGNELVVGAEPFPQAAYRCAPRREDKPDTEALPAPDPKWLCCTCLRPLVATTLQGRVLHGCQQGHGAFVEREELQALLLDAARSGDKTQTAQAHPGAAQVKYVRCPVCSEVMARKTFAPMSGLIVDVCTHGTWFDAGELQRALAFAASRGEGGDMLSFQKGASSPDAARALLEVSLASEARRESESVSADTVQDLFDLFALLAGMPSRFRF